MLLSQGSSLETVNNLSHAEMKSLYYALKNGLWGYSKDYSLSYQNYLMQHSISQTIIASVAGKKFNPVPAKEFHQVYEPVERMMTLGRGQKQRDRMENPAIKTLMSLKPPKHILDRILAVQDTA